MYLQFTFRRIKAADYKATAFWTLCLTAYKNSAESMAAYLAHISTDKFKLSLQIMQKSAQI